MNTQKKGMTGKDIITVGIFSAIYFVTLGKVNMRELLARKPG